MKKNNKSKETHFSNYVDVLEEIFGIVKFNINNNGGCYNISDHDLQELICQVINNATKKITFLAESNHRNIDDIDLEIVLNSIRGNLLKIGAKTDFVLDESIVNASCRLVMNLVESNIKSLYYTF